VQLKLGADGVKYDFGQSSVQRQRSQGNLDGPNLADAFFIEGFLAEEESAEKVWLPEGMVLALAQLWAGPDTRRMDSRGEKKPAAPACPLATAEGVDGEG
jgi:hypothetical protein